MHQDWLVTDDKGVKNAKITFGVFKYSVKLRVDLIGSKVTDPETLIDFDILSFDIIIKIGNDKTVHAV